MKNINDKQFLTGPILIKTILISAILLLYRPAAFFDFLLWDDGINIYNNPYFNPPGLGNTLHFWLSPFEKLYIPLTYTIWAILSWLSLTFITIEGTSGLNPALFHTVNIILHILNTMMVYIILNRIVTTRAGIDIGDSDLKINLALGAGAALFALHPVQAEPVCWATGMKDLLCAFFSLISIHQFLLLEAVADKSKPAGFSILKKRHYIFCLLSFVAAVLTKPVAIILPLIYMAIDKWLLKTNIYLSLILQIPMLLVGAASIVINKSLQPDSFLTFIPPLWTRIFIAGDTAAFYLLKLILPFHLAPDYGRTPEFLLQQGSLYFTWILPALFTAFILTTRIDPVYKTAASVFILALIPVSGIIPFEFQNISTVADRYMYLSVAGPSLALSAFLAANKNKVFLLLSFMLLLILGVKTAHQIVHWKSDDTLFTHMLRINQNSYKAHNNLGFSAATKGNYAKAEYHFRESAKINPKHWKAYSNLGSLLMRYDRTEEAIEYFQKALQFKPDAHRTLSSLGDALVKKGRFDEALQYLEDAEKRDPNNAKTQYNLALVFSVRGEPDKALYHYFETLRLKPDDANTYNNIGALLASQGEMTKAIYYFNRALEVQPDFIEARNNMNRALSGGR